MIIKGSLIITPQSELAMDVSLKQIADDALAVLDVAPKTAFQSNLTELVAGWNMTESKSTSIIALKALDNEIEAQLNGIMYNIDFAYVIKMEYHFNLNSCYNTWLHPLRIPL